MNIINISSKALVGLMLIGLSIIASSGHAQEVTNPIYSADFSTFQTGVIDGNNGWVTSSPNGSGPGYVDSFPGISNNVLNFGGYPGSGVDTNSPSTLPQQAYNYTFHPFSLNTSGSQSANGVEIQSSFAVTPSSNGHQDSFGITLFNTGGQQLVSFDLNPYSSSTLELGYSTYGALGNNSYTIGTGSQTAPYQSNSFTSLKINYGTLNSYDLQFMGIGTSAWTLSLSINGISLYSGAINGDFSQVSQDIGTAAFTWLINNTTNPTTTNGVTYYPDYGDNQMVIQNLNVAALAVPEPKTWVLLGLSGLIMVVAFRNRRA